MNVTVKQTPMDQTRATGDNEVSQATFPGLRHRYCIEDLEGEKLTVVAAASASSASRLVLHDDWIFDHSSVDEPDSS